MACAAVAIASTASPSNAAFPGRNGRIAFEQSEECGQGLGCGTIRTIFPSGRPGHRLVPSGSPNVDRWFDPAFSPSGRKAVIADANSPGLYVITASGAKWRLISDPPANVLFEGSPDWSRSGRSIVFQRDEQPKVGEPRSTIRVYAGGRSHELAAGESPAWSVRGQIAFVRHGDIWVMGSRGEHRHRVVASGEQPDWSPDGRRLAFTRDGFVFVCDRFGKGCRRLARGSDPAFSPDGSLLAYIGGGELVLRLQAVPLAGGRPRPLASLRNDDADFGWSGTDWQPLRR